MKYKFYFTSKFKKEYRKLSAQNMEAVDKIIQRLLNGEKLEPRYCDHQLSGKLKDFRDCHVHQDLVLIYKIEEDILLLTTVNIGSHSNLF